MYSNKKIYWFLSLLSLGSYGWIGYHLLHTESHETSTHCLFKKVTSIACPSCGVTRSVLLLMKGEVTQAILMNPLGVIALALLLIIPIWIVFDFLQNKTTMLAVYTRSEEIIRKRKLIYIPLITLVAINWIWNISKGL